MFDPQRLLGQMLGDALSGQLGGKRRKHRAGGLGSLSVGTKATVALGLLGLAFAAYEHYQQQVPAAVAPGAAPPPPPCAAHAAVPPPPPGAAHAAVPPPPPGALQTA